MAATGLKSEAHLGANWLDITSLGDSDKSMKNLSLTPSSVEARLRNSSPGADAAPVAPPTNLAYRSPMTNPASALPPTGGADCLNLTVR
jgi:hypothetical protein